MNIWKEKKACLEQDKIKKKLDEALFFKTDMREKETKAANKNKLEIQIKNGLTLYNTKKKERSYSKQL